MKEYIEGSVYSGSAQTTRSGKRKKSPNSLKKKVTLKLNDKITARDLKLNDLFNPVDNYKNIVK